MNIQIKCPYCNKLFEPTDAYKHELEEKLLKEVQLKHQEEVEQLKRERQELVQSKEKEIEEAKKEILERAKKEAIEKARKEYDAKIESSKEEAQEREKQNKELQEQIKGLFKQLREIKGEKDKLEIDYQKKLLEEEDKIKQNAKKETEEELSLKMAEKDKKLSDAEKQIRELQRKIQQGSQQTQGEVLELELEEILRKEFTLDNIKEVKKGQRGADIVQEVIDKLGRKCGIILWESKNAQWSDGWINKLKEDQRQTKAHLGVLVVSNPPQEIKTFTYKEGIWITTRKTVVPLALALRFNLVSLNYEKLANVGKNEKMEILYQYITSIEFKQRIEAIVEAFGNLQGDVEREKRWFQTKWARQEKQLRKVIDHTQGMYGDLQGVIGKSLPDIKTLQLESGK